MEYGIFTSQLMEIAQTRFWTLCLHCNANKSIISAELYNGVDNNKTLAAIVIRNMRRITHCMPTKYLMGKSFLMKLMALALLLGKNMYMIQR